MGFGVSKNDVESHANELILGMPIGERSPHQNQTDVWIEGCATATTEDIPPNISGCRAANYTQLPDCIPRIRRMAGGMNASD